MLKKKWEQFKDAPNFSNLPKDHEWNEMSFISWLFHMFIIGVIIGAIFLFFGVTLFS